MDQNRTCNRPGGGTTFALGRQVTLEYQGCNAGVLLDKDSLEEIFLKAARDSGATIVGSTFHDFKPQGISGVVMIAESHFTVHAWPEHAYAAVDIFTCGTTIDLVKASDSLAASLGAAKVVVSADMKRGIISGIGESGSVDNLREMQGVYPISWKNEVEAQNPRGVLSSVDLYGCCPDRVEDADSIRNFVMELGCVIDAEATGECNVVRFSDDQRGEGFVFTQPMGASLISGHFSFPDNTVYLDVFGCNYYEPRSVAEFALAWFMGDSYRLQLAIRS